MGESSDMALYQDAIIFPDAYKPSSELFL